MIPPRFEYAFILALFILTGVSLTWKGVRVALELRAAQLAIVIFVGYCLVIEIVALSIGWWSFDASRIVGVYVWRIPIEELLLFVAFAIVVLGAWESLRNECR